MVSPCGSCHLRQVFAFEFAPVAALALHAGAACLARVVPCPAEENNAAAKVAAGQALRNTGIRAEDALVVCVVQVVDNDGQVGLEALWSVELADEGVGGFVELVVLTGPYQVQVHISHVGRQGVGKVSHTQEERPTAFVVEHGHTIRRADQPQVAMIPRHSIHGVNTIHVNVYTITHDVYIG